MCLALAACRADEPAPPSVAAEPTGPEVVLQLDERAPVRVAITHPIELAELVPTVPAWLYVEATSRDGRYLELQEPATTYPDAKVRLDVRDELVVLGVYPDPPRDVSPALAALASQPVLTLTGVTDVHVWTHPPPRPSVGGISLEIDGRPAQQITPELLADVAEYHEGRMRGWWLRDVIAIIAPNVAVATVEVIGDGAPRTLPGSELSGERVMLKKNQKGQFVIQLWGASRDRADSQIRAVTRVVVTPAR